MNPPARQIRIELNDALVEGIRARGPEAVGFVIIGLARILVAVVVLALLLVASRLLGVDVSAGPFAGMTAISALVSWLVTRKDRWAEKTAGARSAGA